MDRALHAATLIKAADNRQQEEEGERPEAWARPIEDAFAASGRRVRDDLLGDLARLGGAITRDQIGYLKILVRQHYMAHLSPDARAAFWAIPEGVKAHWRQMGILGPSGHQQPLEAIDEMVVAARVAELLAHGTSYAAMVRMARDRPMSRIEELSQEVARDHAGYAIGRLADRHGDLLIDEAQRRFQADFGKQLADFLAGRLYQGDRPVASATGLASALRRRYTVEGGDIERDWRRVAVSETRFAYNYASFIHYLEQGWRKIYYVVQPDACAHCKRLLLMPDGVTPRIFDLDDVIEDLARGGGTNAGRLASKIGAAGGWLPTALIHPWCRCRPLPHLPGLPSIPVGDLRKKR